MYKVSTLVIVLVVILMPCCLVAQQIDELIDRSSRSTVAIGLRDSATGVWIPLATGVILSTYEESPDLLVTNRHVVEYKLPSGERVSRLWVKTNVKAEVVNQSGITPGSWTEFEIELYSRDTALYTCHPNGAVDIAVMYFPSVDTAAIKLYELSNVVRIGRSFCLPLDSLMLSQDVLFWGFPSGLGTVRNPHPLLRCGMVSYIDDQGGFILIDAQAFGGSSGSPVFATGTSRFYPLECHDIRLIGIIAGSWQVPLQSVAFGRAPSSSQVVQDTVPAENSGLAFVIPVDRVQEAIAAHHERMGGRARSLMKSASIYRR